MALKNVEISMESDKPHVDKPTLTLAAMYLEDKLKDGAVVEIPSLGISISRGRDTKQK